MSGHLHTSWDDHYMLPAYLSFLSWALRQDDCLAQFRAETSSFWSPGATTLERAIDRATGADFAFIQSFSNWLERTHFGTPDDLGEAAA